MSVPLTTQIKDNPYYHKVSFQSKSQCAMLSQIRILDAKRLDRKMGKLTSEEFKKLKDDIFGKKLSLVSLHLRRLNCAKGNLYFYTNILAKKCQ